MISITKEQAKLLKYALDEFIHVGRNATGGISMDYVNLSDWLAVAMKAKPKKKKPVRSRSPLDQSGLRIVGTTVYCDNGEVLKFTSREAAWQAYQKIRKGQ